MLGSMSKNEAVKTVFLLSENLSAGFPGGSLVKNPPANAGTTQV